MLHRLRWMRSLVKNMIKSYETLVNLATVGALIGIGVCCGIAYDVKMASIIEENDELRRINNELLNDRHVSLHCNPKKDERAILSRFNGKLFCEIHTKKG